MKTAISIPTGIFETAEKYAAEFGLSRSQLYAKALQDYLDRHRDEGVRSALDQVYGDADPGLAPSLRKMQARSLKKGKW